MSNLDTARLRALAEALRGQQVTWLADARQVEAAADTIDALSAEQEGLVDQHVLMRAQARAEAERDALRRIIAEAEVYVEAHWAHGQFTKDGAYLPLVDIGPLRAILSRTEKDTK